MSLAQYNSAIMSQLSKSQASTVQRSLLLQLPGEIRNLIYEYALSDPKTHFTQHAGKWCVVQEAQDGSRTTVHDAGQPVSYMELNQLKYVNHQLHDETRGLELGFNDVVFIGTMRDPSITQFAKFLAGLSDGKKDQLHEVSLKHRGSSMRSEQFSDHWGRPTQCLVDSQANTNVIYEFCRSYPNVTVKWHVPWLRQNGYLLHGIWPIAELARDKDEEIRKILKHMFPGSAFLASRPTFLLEYPELNLFVNTPANFRFCPKDDFVDRVAAGYPAATELQRMLFPKLVGGCKGYYELLQTLIDDGF